MSIDVQSEIRLTCLYEGGHFAVLMAMADCANTDSGDGIFPGIKVLAACSRLKPRRTQEIIQDLRADGVVVLVGDDGEDLGPDVKPTGGRGKTAEYRIDLERVQELQALHEAEPGVCDFCDVQKSRRERNKQRKLRKAAAADKKGATADKKGATADKKGAAGASPIDNNRQLEPSKNPPARERLPDGPLANALKEALGPGIFRTYFTGAVIIAPEGKPPKLLLANEHNRSCVATRLGRVVRRVMGDHVEISIAGPANAESEQTPYWVN